MKIHKNLQKSPKLAEIIGIMMGDGCLYLGKSKKYQTIVSFHKKEKDYLNYVRRLFEGYFNYKFCITEIKNEFLLRNTSVFVGRQLIDFGLKEGNKIKNKLVIPCWVMRDTNFILKFMRGIFDTDGCVYCKYNKYAQIQFKLACKESIISLRQALIKLRFNPTKVQEEVFNKKPSWKIYLSRQKEIKRFFEEIKPVNSKHTRRYNHIKN